MFNALKYTQELENVGFTREQAEKSVNILIEIMQENLASKQDIKELGQEIKELESKMESKFRELELRMTIKLGSLMVLTVGAMTAITKLM